MRGADAARQSQPQVTWRDLERGWSEAEGRRMAVADLECADGAEEAEHDEQAHGEECEEGCAGAGEDDGLRQRPQVLRLGLIDQHRLLNRRDHDPESVLGAADTCL
eukprot:3813862-Rhodomonas_salina.3